MEEQEIIEMEEDTKVKRTKKSKKEEKPQESSSGYQSPFAELEKKTKLPLILYLGSFLLVGIMGVLLSLNNGASDLRWSKSIYDWGQDPSNASFYSFLSGMPELIGGLLAILITIGVGLIMYLSRKQNLMKYGSMIVALSLVGFIVDQVWMIIANRPIPNYTDATAFQVWYEFNPSMDGLLNSSFPSLYLTLAGVMFALPYCFNSEKLKALKGTSAVVATVFVVFMGWGLVASGQSYLWDVIFPGVVQFWIAAIIGKNILSIREQELYDIYDRVHLPVDNAYRKILKAKAVLNLTEINALLDKTQKTLQPEEEKQKALKAKEKEVPSLPILTEILEGLEIIIEKVNDKNYEIDELISELLSKYDSALSIEKPLGVIESTKQNLVGVRDILEDNKIYALNLLEEAKSLYNEGIEAAENEAGDFQYVIDKANIWLEHVERFSKELEKLEKAEGDEYLAYMKANFLYII